MDAAKISELREVLLKRRTELEGEIENLENEMVQLGREESNETGSMGNHLAEDGSFVTEQSRILTVTGDFHDVLAQINEAMQRMDDGTYEDCRRCGQPINPERLEAFPYVIYCIDCQSLLEREQALRAGQR